MQQIVVCKATPVILAVYMQTAETALGKKLASPRLTTPPSIASNNADVACCTAGKRPVKCCGTTSQAAVCSPDYYDAYDDDSAESDSVPMASSVAAAVMLVPALFLCV